MNSAARMLLAYFKGVTSASVCGSPYEEICYRNIDITKKNFIADNAALGQIYRDD